MGPEAWLEADGTAGAVNATVEPAAAAGAVPNCSNDAMPAGVVCVRDPAEMLDPLVHNSFFYEILVTHAVALVFGVLGNGVVVAVMLSDRKARSATNLFLVSLAAADLLLLLVYGPLETVRYFITQWDAAGSVCRLAQCAQLLSAAASVLNLAAVTLERFLVIVFPMKSRSYCTLSNCRRAILVVWLVALLLTSPVFLTEGSYTVVYTNVITNITVYHCGRTGVLFAVYQFVILFGAPGILMIVCYTFVIMELWRSTRKMRVLTNTVSMKNLKSLGDRQQHNPPQSHSNCSLAGETSTHNREHESEETCSNGRECKGAENLEVRCTENTNESAFTTPSSRNAARRQNRSDDVRKARKQVIKMLILVVVLFLICWGSKIIMDIFMKLGVASYSPTTYGIRIFIFVLPVIHACMNPFIYSFMSKNFRRSLQRQLERMGCKKASSVSNMSGIHGSSRSSRLHRDTITSQKSFRPCTRHRPGRGSSSSSINCHTEFTKYSEVEHIPTTAEV